jgi:hypothetical protein
MWDNRNTVRVRGFSPVRPDSNFVNGTTAYARHMGKDAVYVTLHPDLSGKLFRYTIHDVADPDQDTWELVGIKHAAYTGKGAGAFDTSRNSLRSLDRRRSGQRIPGLGPEQGRADQYEHPHSAPRDLSERVPDRQPAVLRHGLTTACAGLSRSGARGVTSGISRRRPIFRRPGLDVLLGRPCPTPRRFEPPIRANFAGVLGKWKYARRFDIFLGVFEGDTGDVYAYKPFGWQPE